MNKLQGLVRERTDTPEAEYLLINVEGTAGRVELSGIMCA